MWVHPAVLHSTKGRHAYMPASQHPRLRVSSLPHLVWTRLSAVQSCLTGLQWNFFLCPLLLLKSSNGLV